MGERGLLQGEALQSVLVGEVVSAADVEALLAARLGKGSHAPHFCPSFDVSLRRTQQRPSIYLTAPPCSPPLPRQFGAACRFLHGQPREQQHGAAPLHINQVPREPQELPAAVPAPAAQHHTEPPLPCRALPSAPPPPPERQHSDAASDDLSMAALLRNMLPGSEQHGTAGQEGGSDTVEGTPTPPAGGSQPGMEGAAATSASHAAGGAAHTVDTRAAHEAEGSAARAGGPAVPGMVGSAALSSVEGSSGGGTAVEPDLMVLLQRRLPSLLCPLTGQAFADPVVAADGCVYERAAIESYLYQ